jgi:hypothetical protein
MKPISREALRQYYTDTLYKPAVLLTIERSHERFYGRPRLMKDFIPSCQFHDTITEFKGESKVAGYAVGTASVHIATWILRDSTQAKGVVRHEIAHLVQRYMYGDSCRPHGKEFIQALKIVSPNNWRKDRHWHDSPEVAEVRKECEHTNKIHLT